MAALKKKLDEAQKLKDQAKKLRAEVEKARDEAEQCGYDIGIAKTEDALRAEVPTVCQAYCAQTWEKALNQIGIEASSELRRPENVYIPLTIRASDLPSNQNEVAFTVADPVEEALPQAHLPPN